MNACVHSVPRPYQLEGLNKTYAAVEDKNTALVYAPTGVGKTELAFLMIAEAIAAGHKVLVITDQITLNRQWDTRAAKVGIAANDIGAINYLTDIKNLDLWGLGSMNVAKARRSQNYDPEKIYELSQLKNTNIAIVYKHWFWNFGGLPHQWIKAGEWKIQNNVVCGGSTVTFFAVDSSKIDDLLLNLKDFSSNLPEDVIQNGEYLNLKTD